VVKTVVKQALTHKTGNVAREKVLEPQGKIANKLKWSSTLSKTPKAGALPAALHPDMKFLAAAKRRPQPPRVLYTIECEKAIKSFARKGEYFS